MRYNAILNYLIAYYVDGGPVSTTAQGELCGINQLHSKALLCARVCLLLRGTERHGLSQSVICLKGQKG